jgi:hypothetical protein
MRNVLLAAALIAGSCTLAMAQGGQSGGGGQGTSATPSLTQNPKSGTMRDAPAPTKKVYLKKKKKSRT